MVRPKIKRIADIPNQRDHLYADPIVRIKMLLLRFNLRGDAPGVIYDPS